MKALITLSIVLFCWFTTLHLFAQVSAYTFTPLVGTFTEITVSGGANELSLPGGNLDNGWFNNIPTGFNFVFDGTNYTALSAATDGFVLLGANLGSAYYTNNLTSGTPRPKLAPLWDDLKVGSSGSFRYVTTGTTGSKVFTAQWLMMYWNYSASTASVSFQVKLYESSNKIEFIYRQEAASPIGSSASIGISGTNTGSGNFLSINGSGINPAVSSSTETTTISTTPITGQTYRFSPPGPVLPNCADTPNPPSGVTITPSILCWSDEGGNASGFKLYLDTINPPTMLVQDSSTLCYSLSTMSLNKTYYWKVVPYNLAGETSACSVWNFTTIDPCPGLSGSSIYGTLSYDNDPVNSSISCSKIYLKTNSGIVIDSTFTDQNGYYYFCQVPLGDYKLSVKTNKACGGINSTDALLDMKHFTQLINLVGLRYLAGEVNGNNFINSIDALLIAKRFVGYNTTFPVGDWAFDEPQINISLSGAHIINIKGICIGDVDGSYAPPKITISLAGPDQLNLQDTNTILVANQPAIGETGLWTILGGTGGTLANSNSPQSSFTGLAGQTYQLIWTISNACNNSNTDTLVVSFALPMGQPCPGLTSFIYGGLTYNTVQIGTQCIMKENLNIGTCVPSTISGILHSDVSNNGIIEKYCYNNDTANCAIYGGLYDWNEMMQYSTTPGIQGICPAGWHIPTNAEWDTLVSFLGGSSGAGGKMKETGFVHWSAPNYGATNQSGFTAFGAGYRDSYGDFTVLQYYATFWSSSQFSDSPAWDRILYYDGASVSQVGNDKTYGLSLRCFKDTCSLIPTHSDAGPDQILIDTITTLSANTPTSGTGSWSIISGTGGSIAQPNSPVSGFTGNTGTTYTLLWTIATICSSSIDTVIISINSSFICGTSTFIYGGQTYNTVQIGTQCIMKENLNIGTYVPSIFYTSSYHSDVSNNGIIEKYCYNNDTANCAIYGGLYDWNEMMQYSTTAGIQGICPAGWHIPTDAEWSTLVSFLGGSSAGGQMKETGFVYWSSPNTGATNLSGFTAFGAGYRGSYGNFLDLQLNANFWSSSQYSSTNAWFRYLSSGNTSILQGNYLKTLGFSLRCFKE